MKKTIHLKGLNGLRAIAALAVVISHTTLGLNNFGLNPTIFGSDENGHPKGLLLASYGVSIFFALSGFLITYLLLKEKEKINKINIKKFYIRRALRIWPLYYLYIILVLIILWYFKIPYDKKIIPFYIFLMANIPIIINNMLPFAGHLWSIGVEEQFYLFWPWIVKKSQKKLLKTSIILIFALMSLKIVFWLINFKYNYSIPYIALSVTRVHIMMMGAVTALLYFSNHKLIETFTNKGWQIFSWLIIFMVAINKFHISSLIDNEIVGFVTLIIILGQITRRNYILNLENPIMNFIGKISYGIYVYHPLLIFLLAKFINNFHKDSIKNYLFVYSLVIFSTIFVAYISYYYFEKYFIDLKRKFAIINSRA